MSEWSHLPNARHIDWVIESVRTQPQAWEEARIAARGAARDVAWGAAWDAAWDAARDAARGAAWDAARDAAWDAARDVAWDAAWDAAWAAAEAAARGTILALVAFDYAGDILDMPVPAVRLLAASGDPAAVLLLPAVIVRHGGSDE